MTLRCSCLILVVLAASSPQAGAADPPSWSKQVRPFLNKYCVECHNAKKAGGDLELDTYKKVMSMQVVEVGKPDKSLLLQVMEGKKRKAMPPPKSLQPKKEEIAAVRAWVEAGAKDDSAGAGITLPDVQPKLALAPPITALAYHPGGKLLAAAGRKEVHLIDGGKAEAISQLPGQTEGVTALAFSRDGTRLAVASGATGSAGEVRLYAVKDGKVAPKPDHVLAGHTDVIYSIAFAPDGKTLASTGYDRLIKLWDTGNGKDLRTLKDHSDTVYGLAFSPDGALLASAAADRVVKVWDAKSGSQLYTLGDATDWLYALAWSPDGKHIAAAGVDKSIRVWRADAAGGKLVHSVFAHTAPVTALAYAIDSSVLYSLSEDRSIKIWDAARMVEKKHFDAQPEAVLSLAVRPDHKQLAIGRYDGALVLLDEATGKAQAQPLPVKPQPPALNKLTPGAGQRGKTVIVTFEGQHLAAIREVTSNPPGLTLKLLADKATPTSALVEVDIPADLPAGSYALGLKGPGGQTMPLPFVVDRFAAVEEQEPNDSPRTGQKVTPSITVAGSLGRAGDVDFFRFDARAGQQVGAQVVTLAKNFEPVLQLVDETGRVLAETTNGLLGHTCDKAGTYALGIRDREYRGGALGYRLNMGDVPIVTSVFPLGLQRGTEAELRLEGVHLGDAKVQRFKAPADAAPGSRLPLTVNTPLGPALGNPSVIVDEFPEVLKPDGPTVPAPFTANGRLAKSGSADTWRFTARKGQRLIVETNARRLGSPLDTSIEILDARGQPVPRAVLRCVAKSFLTFRDHDSATPALRMETWNDFAINDYVWIGNELIRIRALPKNPDDNCEFFAVASQRLGWLDTTPTHHSNGTPMYKVSIHPPGTTFAPNGLPVVPLAYRNDDGGPHYGKDSCLYFDAPADGNYQVRITDTRGQAGSDHAYRLTVRAPQPRFQVRFTPTAPAVSKGSALPIRVTADRFDGFDDVIHLRLDNLPPGFSAPETTIPAGETETVFALWANTDAPRPAGTPLKLIARAMIDGKEMLREATGSLPLLLEPGDIRTTAEQAEVTIQPGQETRLTVTIERLHNFKGRVPLEVRGLPHGVRVLDIGLNGILINPGETSRTIVFYAEPWVKPTEHPIVVFARREGKNTEHAAKSVLLKVAGGMRPARP